MNEQSETPFFPTPVRWFEIPMNTVRWGFVPMGKLTDSKVETSAGQNVQSAPAATFELDLPKSSHIGTLLNEHA